jgi:hypothetical protein
VIADLYVLRTGPWTVLSECLRALACVEHHALEALHTVELIE